MQLGRGQPEVVSDGTASEIVTTAAPEQVAPLVPGPLAVRGLSVRYGDLHVLADVDLELREREIVTVVGPSGCGKTTLLRCVAGLASPHMGAVSVYGTLVDGPLRDVCMVFQNFGLFPWKTLWSNVAYGLKLQHVPKPEIEKRVASVIELVGLEGFERSYPRQLSGGMQQRAGLARALVMEPKLLLMDEPFSAIDAQTREVLQLELLSIWDRRPVAMLFVTHSIDEAIFMADRVVVLGGKPAGIRDILTIDIPRPRDQSAFGHSEFIKGRDRVWSLLRP
ncbi:MAG: ABC transporter ATP-binding protein [Acidimicrobiales bacterium]